MTLTGRIRAIVGAALLLTAVVIAAAVGYGFLAAHRAEQSDDRRFREAFGALATTFAQLQTITRGVTTDHAEVERTRLRFTELAARMDTQFDDYRRAVTLATAGAEQHAQLAAIAGLDADWRLARAGASRAFALALREQQADADTLYTHEVEPLLHGLIARLSTQVEDGFAGAETQRHATVESLYVGSTVAALVGALALLGGTLAVGYVVRRQVQVPLEKAAAHSRYLLDAIARGDQHVAAFAERLTTPVNDDELGALLTTCNLLVRRLGEVAGDAANINRALDAAALVSIADSAGVITYVNGLFCQVSGYRVDELQGATHRLIRSDVHPPTFFRELWRTIATGGTFHGEICNRRKDGSHYWVATTIHPILGTDGRPRHFISIRHDITKRKQAELALEHARADAERARAEAEATLAEASRAVRVLCAEPPVLMPVTANAVLRRVLLVEANPVAALTARAYLGRLGCTVEHVTTVAAALARARATRFELLLIALRLLDGDGCAVSLTLRAEPGPNRATLMIALAAREAGDARLRCLAAGMTEVIVLPLTPMALQRALAIESSTPVDAGDVGDERAAEPG